MKSWHIRFLFLYLRARIVNVGGLCASIGQPCSSELSSFPCLLVLCTPLPLWLHTGVPVRVGSEQHVETPPLPGRAPLHLHLDLDLTLRIQWNVISLIQEPLTHSMSLWRWTCSFLSVLPLIQRFVKAQAARSSGCGWGRWCLLRAGCGALLSLASRRGLTGA